MIIDIQARHFSLTEALRTHTERRLHFAFNDSDDHIQRITIRLSDINGPRGGPDKRCQLHAVLAGLPDVIVDDIESDLYIAIDRAIDRSKRTVMRKLKRHQTLQTQLPHHRPSLLDIENAELST